MKKILSMVLVVVLVVSLLSSCAVIRYDPKIEYVEQDGKLILTKYNSGKTDLVVPAYVAGKPVVAVAEGAFSQARYLRTVVFEGESLEYVEDGAFASNGFLTKVEFPASLKTVGAGAFANCSILGEVVFHGPLENLGEKAFSGCDRLTTITTENGSILNIEKMAFYRCKMLQNIDLSSTQSIGEFAFGGCDGFVDSLEVGAIDIADGAFIACDNLESVNLTNVQNMGKAVFSDCGNLISVKMSENITELPDSSYEGCRKLQTVKSADLTQVGRYAFHQCSSLNSLFLADGAQIYESSVKNSGLTGLEVIPEDSSSVTIDGTEYHVTFEDDFDGSELDSTKWEHCPEWNRGEIYWNDEDAFLDGNGNLILTVSYGECPDGSGTDVYRAGGVRTSSKFDQTYGYYEIRCRMSDFEGVMSAFWLMPYQMPIDGTAGDGAEIDIYESPYYLTDRVNYAVHWDGYDEAHQSIGCFPEPQIDGIYYGYHTYSLKWTDTEYVFYIDGKEFWRVTDPVAICHEKLYVKVTSHAGGWPGRIPDIRYLPLTISETDYVRVYA